MNFEFSYIHFCCFSKRQVRFTPISFVVCRLLEFDRFNQCRPIRVQLVSFRQVSDGIIVQPTGPPMFTELRMPCSTNGLLLELFRFEPTTLSSSFIVHYDHHTYVDQHESHDDNTKSWMGNTYGRQLYQSTNSIALRSQLIWQNYMPTCHSFSSATFNPCRNGHSL